MTQPSSARPVPGPPRAVGTPAGTPAHGLDGAAAAEGTPGVEGPVHERENDPLAGLDQRPVEEHVAVFEAEHDRLQRHLGGIDQV